MWKKERRNPVRSIHFDRAQNTKNNWRGIILRKLMENALKNAKKNQIKWPTIFAPSFNGRRPIYSLSIGIFSTLNGRPKTDSAVTLNPAVRSHLISLSVSFRCFLLAKWPAVCSPSSLPPHCQLCFFEQNKFPHWIGKQTFGDGKSRTQLFCGLSKLWKWNWRKSSRQNDDPQLDYICFTLGE